MVTSNANPLLTKLSSWIAAHPAIVAGILFGSWARKRGSAAAADWGSDVDLHLLVSDFKRWENVAWNSILPDCRFLFKAVRRAGNGATKVTIRYAEGEVDLVLVSAAMMRVVRLAVAMNMHGRFTALADPLNRLATIMSGGYAFIKGEREWGHFYKKIVRMPGVRIADLQATAMAEVFLSDFIWVLQKIQRGELIAAQRVLHSALVETNIAFLHEVRLRQNRLTFQQARRLEQLAFPEELATVRIEAKLDAVALRTGATVAFVGFMTLMRKIIPSWRPPPGAWECISDLAPDLLGLLRGDQIEIKSSSS